MHESADPAGDPDIVPGTAVRGLYAVTDLYFGPLEDPGIGLDPGTCYCKLPLTIARNPG